MTISREICSHFSKPNVPSVEEIEDVICRHNFASTARCYYHLQKEYDKDVKSLAKNLHNLITKEA